MHRVSPLVTSRRPGRWPPDPVATFSILGYDPATGEVGGAVQSRVFSVGNGVLWAEAGVGAAATQAIVDVSYGPKAIALLRAGMKPEAIIKAIWDSDPDPQPERWTKARPAVRGHRRAGRHRRRTPGPRRPRGPGTSRAKYCTAQGNILAGEAVVTGMVEGVRVDDGASVDSA